MDIFVMILGFLLGMTAMEGLHTLYRRNKEIKKKNVPEEEILNRLYETDNTVYLTARWFHMLGGTLYHHMRPGTDPAKYASIFDGKTMQIKLKDYGYEGFDINSALFRRYSNDHGIVQFNLLFVICKISDMANVISCDAIDNCLIIGCDRPGKLVRLNAKIDGVSHEIYSMNANDANRLDPLYFYLRCGKDEFAGGLSILQTNDHTDQSYPFPVKWTYDGDITAGIFEAFSGYDHLKEPPSWSDY